MTTRTKRVSITGVLLPLVTCCLAQDPIFPAAPITTIQGGGEFGELFEVLKQQLLASRFSRRIDLGGKSRLSFVSWIRDHVHVSKAMKHLAPEVRSYLEFYLEHQTDDGLYFDYFEPLDSPLSHRLNIFPRQFWKVLAQDRVQLHRIPVEADLEYLMVEGAWYVWQTTGDRGWVHRWLPVLEKGLIYSMTDPLRWSRRFQLVKRGYTLDTWDFMQLPVSRSEYAAAGGDIQAGIFVIDGNTPMGIMHGDNSGMYAACRQLAALYEATGDRTSAAVWNQHAEGFRVRTNAWCWNGKFYKHFVVDDPMPPYLRMDQDQTLGLSNPYSINRGLPSETMAQSIIEVYRGLKDQVAGWSFAEWFGIYPAVEPHFAGYEPGSYMNGGVNTIVAGELAKAAFRHGFEEYGVDILHRLRLLAQKHNGELPVAYRPDGTVDEGIPDNWGQAAVFSALIEGLAGVVDQGSLHESVEISPRWTAAQVGSVEVQVGYGAGGRRVHYQWLHQPAERQILVNLLGNAGSVTLRVLLPEGVEDVPEGSALSVRVNGTLTQAALEMVRKSRYAVLETADGAQVEISY